MSENKHNEMEQKELVKQLCEFIIYDAKDVDDNINDEDFDKHLKKKFPLINGDSFYNWKSLYLYLYLYSYIIFIFLSYILKL